MPVRVAADSNLDQATLLMQDTLDSLSSTTAFDIHPIDLLPAQLPDDINNIILTPPLRDTHGTDLVPAITGKVIKGVATAALSSQSLLNSSLGDKLSVLNAGEQSFYSFILLFLIFNY